LLVERERESPAKLGAPFIRVLSTGFSDIYICIYIIK
jgi:hypothetical protein